MRSPELLLVDSDGKEESLHRFEALPEVTDADLDLVAAIACRALHEHALDVESTSGFAEIQAAITERVVTLISQGVPAEQATASFFRHLREHIQKLARPGDYSFQNEEIPKFLGSSKERGVLTDAIWYERESSKPVDEQHTRQFYVRGRLDNAYAVDFMEAIWMLSQDGELSLEQIDLVQTKTSEENLSAGKSEDIVKKHKHFLMDRRPAIAEFLQIEVTSEQLDKLEGELGLGTQDYATSSMWEALTMSSSEGKKYFESALQSLRRHISDSKAFISSSKPLKRAYIESLAISNDADLRSAAEFPEFETMFDTWKEEWASTIGDRKKRVVTPIQAVRVRSVISINDQKEPEIEVIQGQ